MIHIVEGDMFDGYLDPMVAYCIPTNGITKNNGEAVMGAGVALEAKKLQPAIPKILGEMLMGFGNRPFILPYNFLSIPTKLHWKDPSDLDLIDSSLEQVNRLCLFYNITTLHLPLLGCGLGGLKRTEVEPIIRQHLEHIREVYLFVEA